MLVVTYSEARKTFASILDKAKEDGAVIIKRADGSLFRLSPEQSTSSPFDGIVTGIHLEPGELQSAFEDSKRFSESRFRISRKVRE